MKYAARCSFRRSAALMLVSLIAAACEAEGGATGVDEEPAPETPAAVVTKITASPANHVFEEIGATLQISATATDSAGAAVEAPDLTWKSSDTAVVRVDKNGKVTAAAAGSAQVIVSSGAVADTVSVSVVITPSTPEPPDSGESLYPNRPAGVTLIGSFDGSVKERDGHAFGISDFGRWYDHNDPSDITVVDDPTNPVGSGKALRFRYPSNDNKAGSAAANTFSGGPYRELYVMIRVFMEPSGWDTFGNKFFYIGAAPGSRHYRTSPVQYYTDRPSGRRLRFINQNLTADYGSAEVVVASHYDPPVGTRSQPVQQGVWLNMEYHMVAESAPGAGDGRMEMWVNGELVGYNNAVQWTQRNGSAVGFSGMEWYAEVNEIPVTSYYRLGELYIAGIR